MLAGSIREEVPGMARQRKGGGKGHRFGGDWTSEKLGLVAEYLQGYTTALKNTRFRKGYVDAFAGTGYRELREATPSGGSQELLFPDLAADEPQGLLDGSARLALQIEPPFDAYVFIEQSGARCRALEELRTEFPALADRIDVRQGEANAVIQALCQKSWRTTRAVMFLDPYGMQVEWATLEAIAGTRAIDLWVLFPLGIGVGRLLTRSGDIPPSWRRRLNFLLGNEEWYEEFYRLEKEPTLFGGDEERVVRASLETIGRYFNRRLASIFHAVAPEPRVLKNSKNCPLYLLCFAAGNPKGAPTALRIAQHLLERGTG
jgi:three-Cys-motif partner protein